MKPGDGRQEVSEKGSPFPSFICSFVHLCAYVFICLFVHLLDRSLILSFGRPLTRSPVQSLTSLVHPLTASFVYSFTPQLSPGTRSGPVSGTEQEVLSPVPGATPPLPDTPPRVAATPYLPCPWWDGGLAGVGGSLPAGQPQGTNRERPRRATLQGLGVRAPVWLRWLVHQVRVKRAPAGVGVDAGGPLPSQEAVPQGAREPHQRGAASPLRPEGKLGEGASDPEDTGMLKVAGRRLFPLETGTHIL